MHLCIRSLSIGLFMMYKLCAGSDQYRTVYDVKRGGRVTEAQRDWTLLILVL